MASQDWLEKDFYKILDVDKNVSEKDLTKKYHKLAHKYHPDSNPGDTVAEEKFKQISEAYSVLSDPEQRQEYDQIRAMGAGGARFTSGGGPGGGFEDMFGGMFGGQNVRFGQGGGAGGYENIFNMFTGAGGFGGGFREPEPGRDLSAQTTLDFKQAARGDTVTLQTPHGKVHVRIPAGVADGKKIKVRGKGEPSRTGGPRGDLILTVHVRKHPVFDREGKNLRLKLPVTITEAAFGATVEVPTLDGKPVKLKVAPGTPSGRVLRLKGRGIETKTGTGDLLAEVQIVVPSHLTDTQKEALEAYQAVEPDEDPRADLLAKAGR